MNKLEDTVEESEILEVGNSLKELILKLSHKEKWKYTIYSNLLGETFYDENMGSSSIDAYVSIPMDNNYIEIETRVVRFSTLTSISYKQWIGPTSIITEERCSWEKPQKNAQEPLYYLGNKKEANDIVSKINLTKRKPELFLPTVKEFPKEKRRSHYHDLNRLYKFILKKEND